MALDPISIGIWIVIGAVAGWLAGLIVKWGSLGLIGDIIVGLVGATVAGYLLPLVGIHFGAGFVPQIINAVIGAIILLVIARLGNRVLSEVFGGPEGGP